MYIYIYVYIYICVYIYIYIYIRGHLLFTLIRIFFLRIIYRMYVLIGKEKCNQCNLLKNLLDEKGMKYHYVDG